VANITSVGLEGQVVVERADQAGVGLLDALVRAAQHHLDPALLQLFGQVHAHVVVEAAQDVGAAIEQRRLHAQAVEDAGELDGDIAAADHHHPLGQGRQVEGLVRGDAQLRAREVRLPGPAAGGDQDLAGGVAAGVLGAFLGQHLDGVRVDDLGAAVQQVGAGLLQVGDVDPRQPGDLDVLVVQEALPVEAGLADRPAIALGGLQLASPRWRRP
jgi:hypothetical protein